MQTARVLAVCFLLLPLLGGCGKVAEQSSGTSSIPRGENIATVINANLKGASNVYAYVLPRADDASFAQSYKRQLYNALADIDQGAMENAVIAFASESSTKGGDFAVAALSRAKRNKLKGSRVLFIGANSEQERVEAAVKPSGGSFEFIQFEPAAQLGL